MLEKALKGSRLYWSWIGALVVVIAFGAAAWVDQFRVGLTVTGLGRDVSWGFYIAQFTFLVGVAASAVMVVLPYYLHDFKAFAKITILGECLAIPAVLLCMLFIFVDMGMPTRIFNVFLHPSPHSLMFWDTIALGGYLVLNVVIGYVSLRAERNGTPPPRWIRPVIILSIPWAVSIHTVTAFLYAGLGARPFWLTAILAPRFLASAFAAGPALLLLLALFLRATTRFDPGARAIAALTTIITYAMLVNCFFVLMEVFTTVYSAIPDHLEHFRYLYFGLGGQNFLAPWMWVSSLLAVVALVLLLTPRFRARERLLVVACAALFASLWIDKGLGMVIAGFEPNPFGHVARYVPTLHELVISLGVYAVGALVLTLLYKIVLEVRGQLRTV